MGLAAADDLHLQFFIFFAYRYRGFLCFNQRGIGTVVHRQDFIFFQIDLVECVHHDFDGIIPNGDEFIIQQADNLFLFDFQAAYLSRAYGTGNFNGFYILDGIFHQTGVRFQIGIIIEGQQSGDALGDGLGRNYLHYFLGQRFNLFGSENNVFVVR